MTYEEHYKKWTEASDLVKEYNSQLIREWDSIPWWKFWVKKPSFEEKRQIILDNWSKFGSLSKPRISDYFPLDL